MELSHRGGAEGESLLRPDQRNGAMVTPFSRGYGWDVAEPEKAPFLQNEPVRLTPAWEGANLPNDTLNLKGVGMELAPPRDRYRLIYLTLILHGLGTLTAWNMFITAKSYFEDFKLGNEPALSKYWMNVAGYAAQAPNLLFSWLNIFMRFGGDLSKRIVISLAIEVLLFVLTIALAMVDSTSWTKTFYYVTLVTVAVLNTFNAIFQNSVYGVAAKLPPSYTGAVVLGSNISGTLTVLLDWLSDALAGNEHPRTAAIYYFIGGMFILLVCFDTYFALPLNRFYRYHDTLQERTARNNPALAATQLDGKPRAPPYGTIVRQCWLQLYNVFIVFFVTLAIFPAVQSNIGHPDGFFLTGRNWVRITCFLTFNLTAMLGNISASCVTWPGPKLLTAFTTLRLLFIPFFLLCNYHPRPHTAGPEVTRLWHVFIRDPWLYWAMSALFGWSSGHCSSLGMMYVGKNVAPEHASTAGMIGGATLITGIMAGIAFSNLCPLIVNIDF